MNRRSLLKRIGAIAAAVAVAPAVTMEPAPVTAMEAFSRPTGMESKIADGMAGSCPQCFTTMRPPQEDLGGVCVVCWRRNQATPAIAMPGHTHMVNDDGTMGPTITLAAMAADCEARGCQLVAAPISSAQHPRIITHIDQSSVWAGYDYSVDNDENVLGRVDEWRRGLHEQVSRLTPIEYVGLIPGTPYPVGMLQGLNPPPEYVGLSHTHGAANHTHDFKATGTTTTHHQHTMSSAYPLVGAIAFIAPGAPIPMGWRLLPELDERLG